MMGEEWVIETKWLINQSEQELVLKQRKLKDLQLEVDDLTNKITGWKILLLDREQQEKGE